ncbi:MAG: hypothetical protein ACO3JG_11500 [Luteolibacter sp.]
MTSCLTRVDAAPGDNLRFDQTIDNSGTALDAGSFWNPVLWTDLTAPLESPITPGNETYLTFRTRLFDGTSLATPARNMTIKTAAAAGFSPPPIDPVLARLNFYDGNILHFDGAPDDPSDPPGSLRLSNPTGAPAITLDCSSIDFDRTVVNTRGIRLRDSSSSSGFHMQSAIQITGDAGGSELNLTNTGGTTIEREGAGPLSPLLLRQDARASLSGETDYEFTLHPSAANTGNAAVFRCETGGQLIMGNVTLTKPTGVVFDVDASGGNSSLAADAITSSGKLAGADPLVMFRASGNGATPDDPTLTVNEASWMSDLSGTFAKASDHAQVSFLNNTYFDGHDNVLRVVGTSGGQVLFSGLRTTSSLYGVDGSVQMDWSADGGALIDGGAGNFTSLQLNGASHSAIVTGGAEIRLPPLLALGADATLNVSASGAGSVLSCKNEFGIRASAAPTPAWDQYSFSITAGASLIGGSLVGEGEFAYPLQQSFSISGHVNRSTFTASSSTVDYLSATLAGPVDVNISGSTQRHSSWYLNEDSSFTMSGGTWGPTNEDTLQYSQSLIVGGESGNSAITLTEGAVAHQLSIQIGEGVFSFDGAPPPFDPCSLTVNNGSTWTGSLNGATSTSGQAGVVISGEGTTAALEYANLGATAYPMYNPEMPFFTNPGGSASLTVSEGARLSVGARADAFGNWIRPDSITTAYLILKDGVATIDAASAAYIGDAADATGIDYRNGALVVGPGGFLLGSFTVSGAAADGNDLVVDGGTVLPGFSPGEIEVDGNFLMESGTLVLEVDKQAPSTHDTITADRIILRGGTLQIKAAPNHTPTGGITVDLFDTLSLDIASGFVIEIDPALGEASFNPLSGELTIAGSSPSVAVEQSYDQADPASDSPIYFTVVFSSPVTGFDSSDVTIGGSAGATTAEVTGSAGSYLVAVSGMANSGTVALSIAGNVVEEGNQASTSFDNEVTYIAPFSGFALWQHLNETEGGIDQDHDGDGVPNGVEYFLGGATDTNGPTSLPSVTHDTEGISITWTHAADYSGSYPDDFRVESSDSLTGAWLTEPAGDAVIINGNKVTYTFPSPYEGRKFVRLVVTGP